MIKEYLQILKNYRTRVNVNLSLRALTTTLLLVVICFNLYYLVWTFLDQHSQLLVLYNISLKITLVLLVLFILLSVYKNFWSLFVVARHLDRQIDHEDDLYQNLYELSGSDTEELIINALSSSALKRLRVNKYRIPLPSPNIFSY